MSETTVVPAQSRQVTVETTAGPIIIERPVKGQMSVEFPSDLPWGVLRRMLRCSIREGLGAKPLPRKAPRNLRSFHVSCPTHLRGRSEQTALAEGFRKGLKEMGWLAEEVSEEEPDEAELAAA